MWPKHRKQTRRLAGLAAGASMCLLLASSAWADDREPSTPAVEASTVDPSILDAAAAEYDQGVAAQARGDYEAAAAAFSKADELLPDPVALEAAIQAATLGDLATTAMELVSRARRGPTVESLDEAVRHAEARFASRVGSLRVECSSCQARLGDTWLPLGQNHFVVVGQHVVELVVGGIAAPQHIDVVAGELVVVRPRVPAQATGGEPLPSPARPRLAEPDDAPSRGWSPAWFWAGAGLTAVVGGVTVWSGLDTLSKHDDFLQGPTPERASDGQRAETRTYVFGGVTAGLGIATALVGMFVVDWGAGPAIELGVLPTGVGASVRGTASRAW